MAIHADWLEWLSEGRTDVWISERSGIPRSTIGFVRRGQRDLPAIYRTALRSAYQSETTRRLDAIGVPHRESIRMSMKRPEDQRQIYSDMSYIVNELSVFNMTRAYERSGLDPMVFDWQGSFDAYEEQVIEAIHKSPYTYDDIKERYPTTGPAR